MNCVNFKKIILTIAMFIWAIHTCFATNIQHSTRSKKIKSSTVKTIKHSPHKVTTKTKPKSVQKKKARTKLTKKTYKNNNKPKVIQKKHPIHKVSSLKYHQPTIKNVPMAPTQIPAYSLSSIEQNLVSFVRKTVSTISYTAYKLGGTHIDSSNGIYVVDCSRYVDHILKTIYPQAYTSLTSWSGTTKPTTNDFYHYFTNLSVEDAQNWNTIDDVEQLRPGDILVFRNKNKRGNQTGGHVMVVMDQPARNGNTFSVRIADSAPSGHTKDTRSSHSSGIGIGTMLLKVHPNTFRPYAYAWKIGARWETNVNFAMARPIDLS